VNIQQILESFLPTLITFGPVVLLWLRNQAQAQAILNRQYERLTAELADTKKQLAEAREQFAYERGVLTERVAGLERMLSDERREAEARNRENVQRIATLETQKADLQNQLRRKTDECEGLQKRLEELQRSKQPA
jgi:predicted nuclease with TOPRIM domain